MNVHDGSTVPVDHEVDVVVVGSGAGGATVARWCAAAGLSVAVVEEGPRPPRAPSDARALAELWRDGGGQAALGPDVLPLLQGRCLGGTTVINGAIQIPFPEPVWREWVATDPAWAERLPWRAIEEATARMDRELGVTETPPHLLGDGRTMLGALPGAHPIRRNAPGCVGSGRCLQGCPGGHKRSADVALIPRAVADGAVVWTRARVGRVTWSRGRASGVVGRFAQGPRFRLRARRAVVLAAGAVHTPWLLLRSGVRAGRGFTCHPGVAVAGRFADPVAAGPRATQPVQATGDLADGLKYEILGMPSALKVARFPGVGRAWLARAEAADHVSVWGTAVRAEARGRVLRGPFGPLVVYRMTPADRARALRGVARTAEALLAAGAEEVWPGVHGAPEVITRPDQARALASLSPDPGRLVFAATHLFGGSPVVDRMQAAPGLYVADASLFPTNLGVNPMSAITAVATVVAERWIAA